MSVRAEAAVERIRQSVPIIQVLQNYGYRVRDGYQDQQFPCDLHGTGRDNKPSARVYPASNSWYCFGCNQTRDAIETVRAKEGVKFWDAVRILEKAYGLEPLPVDYEPVDRETPVSSIQTLLDPAKTFQQDANTVRHYLDTCTINQDLPLETTLLFWEAFDQVVYLTTGTKGAGGSWSEEQGRTALHGLLEKIKKVHRAST